MNTEQKTMRMFENPVLEALTHSNAWVNATVWYVAGLYFVSRGWGLIVGNPLQALAVAASAYLVWTFTEYMVHRFLFHYEAKSELGKKIFYIMHVHHHDFPDETDRNMLPLIITLPTAVALIIVSHSLFPAAHASLWLGVFAIAYINYDLIHYLTHRPWAPIPMSWKRHHMLHHYRDADVNYGVQTSIWDRLFGTYKG